VDVENANTNVLYSWDSDYLSFYRRLAWCRQCAQLHD